MVKKYTLLNNENEKIMVETYTPDKIKSTIVFCHGIMGCRKGRTTEDNYFQNMAKKLMSLNYKVVLFDFSGHGESEGNDFDVVLSKSTNELALVIENEVKDKDNINFLAFSYGALVLDNYLKQTNINPKKIILFSPCLYPLESCFLNKESIFGKDIEKSYSDGTLKSTGYIIVGAKNFKFSYNMILELQNLKHNYFENCKNHILCLSGKNDVILNTKYNDKFCKENGIKNIYLNSSHSLFEEIEKAEKYLIDFLENN